VRWNGDLVKAAADVRLMFASIGLNKKVFIVSSWAPPALGGPQNLYNIFSRLDGRQYVILTSVVNELQAASHGGFRLPCRYFFYDEEKRDPSYFTRPGTPLLVKAFRRFRRGVRLPGRIAHIISTGLRLIREERAELLLGVSDEGPALILTYLLSRISGVPYLLYLFDLYKGNDLKPPWKTIASVFEPLLFKQARRIIVTNERTRDYYQERYPRSVFDVIHNAVDGETYRTARTVYAPKPPYTIVFTGRIYWAQERSVRNLLRAVSAMDDPDLKCLIYSPNPPTELVKEYASHPRIRFDVASHALMPAVQGRADILFLPLSWETGSPQIIATASPGKLTDYLIAGRPILVHAPKDAFISRYAKTHGFAHVVDQEDDALLRAGITRLLSDVEYAKRLIANAIDTFYRYHDAGPNAEKMAALLNGV
jgi:hypothetical protein